MGQPFSLDSAAEYILLIKPSYPPSNYDGRHRVSNQNPSNSGSDLHLSLSVAVAVTAVLRLVLEAAQVNIAPWSALVTEPYRRLDLVRGLIMWLLVITSVIPGGRRQLVQPGL